MGITIKNAGKAVPELIVKNDDLNRFVETDNEWIVARTGIQERRVATTESGVDLAVAAAKLALDGENYDEIGLVIVATVTPDKLVPSMGALVKKELGLANAVAFDISTACSGFIYGVWIAEALMKNGMVSKVNGVTTNTIRKALIIGVERLSRIVDWSDRSTCILFGDGAGAALLEDNPNEKGILASFVKNYDDMTDSLTCGMEYRKTPFTDEERDNPEKQALSMQGSQVFKFAVNAIGEVMEKSLELAGLTADDIAYFVPHQANLRIISSAAKKFKQPIEKFQISLSETGNVSAASVPMALYDIMDTEKLKKGDKIMLMGFGGGLSAGAVIFEV
ncbi:3-oxoacyl-ACP synthase III family protein [Aminipila terrae]|uniref:Beta-ketoacyl-ACP synthase III n=1 Tax=Aminipila terrae TaxID=2697030 RepID=A0A6P1MEW5_9FIRM|nr:beta-ketoacyl-ACP synthase 3 [Aminipila terrae]QHI72562.1 beta-ketoacyl-ACP synthase III [Aminipila terrae]